MFKNKSVSKTSEEIFFSNCSDLSFKHPSTSIQFRSLNTSSLPFQPSETVTLYPRCQKISVIQSKSYQSRRSSEVIIKSPSELNPISLKFNQEEDTIKNNYQSRNRSNNSVVIDYSKSINDQAIFQKYIEKHLKNIKENQSISEEELQETEDNKKISIIKLSDSQTRHFSIREILNESLKENNSFQILDFFQVFECYSKVDQLELKQKKTWKTCFFSYFCKCFISDSEFDPYIEEIIEKFVSFSYSDFNHSSQFHRNLLLTAGSIIFSSSLSEDLQKKYESLLKQVKTNSKLVLLVLLNIIFLNSFFKDILKCLKDSFKEADVLKIVYKLSLVSIKSLRKKKLNKILMKTKKIIELIFFFFAGICLYFLALSRKHKNSAMIKIKIISKKKIEEVLYNSKKFYLEHLQYN